MLKTFFELLKKGDIKSIMLTPTEDNFLQFFRYIFVGGASFVADSGLLFIITEAGLPYLISGVISFTFGLAVNYILSKLLVFSNKTEGAERNREIAVFAIVAVCGLGITEGLMWLFTEKIGLWYMLSKVIAAGIVLFWNFFMKKLLLYSKKK